MRKYIKNALVLTTSLFVIGLTAAAVCADDAAQDYAKNCKLCHGPSGKGDGPAGKMLKPPPADFAAVLKDKSDSDVAKVIKEGGKAVGKSTAMPAFGSKLTDGQIQAVVAYLKGLK